MKQILLILILLFSSALFANELNENFNKACETGNIVECEKLIKDVNLNELTDDGLLPIITATMSNKYDIVKLLISNGADVNLKDKYSTTALHEAVRSSNLDIVKLLLENKADVNAIDRYKNTSLYRAVIAATDLATTNNEASKGKNKKDDIGKLRNNKLEIIKLLLANNAEMNCINTSGSSPIMQAIIDSNLSVLDLFIENGFNVNSYVGEEGNIPLSMAIRMKNKVLFNYFLSKKANIRMADSMGYTPMYSAVIVDDKSTLTYFLNNGIDVNEIISSEGDTALAAAVKLSKEDLVPLLIDKGSSLNVRDKEGFSLAHDAVMSPEILKILIDKKVNVNIKNNLMQTPLHLATLYNKLDSVMLLLKAGAVLNIKDLNGKTPLDIAKENSYNDIITALETQEKNNTGENVTLLDENEPKLFTLIKEQKIEEIKSLISANAENSNIDTKDYNDNTALHVACRIGNIEIIKLLLDKGTNINAQNFSKTTPLYIAVLNNNFDLVNLLLSKGADVNISDILGKTPLMLALQSVENQKDSDTSYKMVKLLLDNGAGLNAKDKNGEYVIHYAAKYPNINIVKLLVEKGIDVNQTDVDGNTPIYFTIKSSNKTLDKLEVIKLFLSINLNINIVNSFKQTPLHIACQNNADLEIIKLLLDKENVNLLDNNKTSVLVYAVRNGNLDLIKLLDSYGADFNISVNGLNLIHEALLQSNVNIDILKLLINHKVDINALSKYGTPLSIAIESGRVDIVKLLIDNGVDVNKLSGIYPIFKAILSKNSDIVNLLLDSKADTNVLYYENITPLMLAVKYSNYSICERLINLGADVNAVSKDGFTASHLLVYNDLPSDRLKILSLLISKNANLKAVSSEGITPIHSACGTDSVEVVKILKDNGCDPKILTKLQINAITVAKDRGYKDILDIFNEPLPPLKENEKYDTDLYVLKITEIDNKQLLQLLINKLESSFLNSKMSYSFSDGTLTVNMRSSYVIGELQAIFGKIETKDFKLDKQLAKDCDLLAKIKYR